MKRGNLTTEQQKFFDAGIQSERHRFARLKESFKDDLSSIVEYFEAGYDSTELQKEKIQTLERQIKRQDEENQIRTWALKTDDELRRTFSEAQSLKEQFSSPEAFLAFVHSEQRRLSG